MTPEQQPPAENLGPDSPNPGSHDRDVDEQHVATRAQLLPEELAAGSDDPQAQAEAILAESEERTEHPDADASTQTRRRSSGESV